MTRRKFYYSILHPRATLTKVMYRALRWLPIPYQDRWTATIQLLRVQIHFLATDVGPHPENPQEAESRATRVIYQSARMWLERRLASLRSSAFKPDLVADAFTVVVKSLDMPSRIVLEKETITVTTFACPFAEDARRAGDDTAGGCQRVCGGRRSFFRGVSDAFPFYVSYRAPSMMGVGDPVCVKEVAVRADQPLKRRPRWRRYLSRHRRHGRVTILEEPVDVSAARTESLPY